MHPFSRRRILDEFRCGAARTNNKFSSAIWAFTSQHRLRTRSTKGAFEGADARFGRFRREILVAALTVWTSLTHYFLLRFGKALTMWLNRRELYTGPTVPKAQTFRRAH